MKLQFLKGDSVLPTILYHPYSMTNLFNFNNYSKTYDYKRSSVVSISDITVSSSTNSSTQISESNSEGEYADHSESNEDDLEKEDSLSYVSSTFNILNSSEEVPYLERRIEDKNFNLQSKLHSYTDETILKLSDLIQNLKLQEENFDTVLSTAIGNRREAENDSCFIIEDFCSQRAIEDVSKSCSEISGFEKFISECFEEEVDDTSQYQIPVSNCPYIPNPEQRESQNDIILNKLPVGDRITNTKIDKDVEIIMNKSSDTKIDFVCSETKKSVENILENNQDISGHLKRFKIPLRAKTNINFLKKSQSEPIIKPANLTVSVISSNSKAIDKMGIKPLSLAKLNFTQKIHSSFSKPLTFLGDNAETFESKFSIFDLDDLNSKSYSVFRRNMGEKEFKVIPYKNESILRSSSHSFASKIKDNDDNNTEKRLEYHPMETNNGGKRVRSKESGKGSKNHISDELSSQPENIQQHSKVENNAGLKMHEDYDSEFDNTYESEDEMVDVFLDEEGDSFFDSLDELVLDQEFQCVEDTEFIYTSKCQNPPFGKNSYPQNCAASEIHQKESSEENHPKEALSKEKNARLFSDLPIIFKCIDEDTLEEKEVLLYPKEQLETLLNASNRISVSRDEAIKQIIKLSKKYDGKPIGIVSNIKEPQYLQTEERDSNISLESSFIDSTSVLIKESKEQAVSNFKCVQKEDFFSGDVPSSIPSLVEHKAEAKTIAIPPVMSLASFNSLLPKADFKENNASLMKCCMQSEAFSKIPYLGKQTFDQRISLIPSVVAKAIADGNDSFKPSASSICIRYQRHQAISAQRSSSAPIIKTIEDNVERHSKHGCERYRRYSTYCISPRRTVPKALPWSIGMEFGNSAAQGCNEKKNKRVNTEEIVASDFKTHFQNYAKRGRLKSGSVISKANSNYWLRKTGIVYDDQSEKIAEDCFAEVAGKKLVLNIFDYIKYLIAVSRKNGLALMDLVDQLKGLSSRDAESKKVTYQKSCEPHNFQTLCPSAMRSSAKLRTRVSRIPVSFPRMEKLKNSKHFCN